MDSCNHQFVHLVGDIVCYLFLRQRAADEIKIMNISLFKFVFTQQMQHVKCQAAGGFHCEIKLYISSASMFSGERISVNVTGTKNGTISQHKVVRCQQAEIS